MPDAVPDPMSDATRYAARAFRLLPDRWQHALRLAEIERMPPADLAPLVGLSETAAESVLRLARGGMPAGADLAAAIAAADAEPMGAAAPVTEADAEPASIDPDTEIEAGGDADRPAADDSLEAPVPAARSEETTPPAMNVSRASTSAHLSTPLPASTPVRTPAPLRLPPHRRLALAATALAVPAVLAASVALPLALDALPAVATPPERLGVGATLPAVAPTEPAPTARATSTPTPAPSVAPTLTPWTVLDPALEQYWPGEPTPIAPGEPAPVP